MKKTRLGCTILEGSDVANLPLVSQNAQILDTEIDKVEKKGILTEKKITETNKNILDIEKDISERWGTIVKNIDGADLDEVIQSGVYSGNKLINGPSDDTGPFYIEVFRRSSSAVYQRVIYWTGSNVIGLSERFLANGTWRDWKSIAYKDDIKKAMDRADAAFQSASDGKKVVATAITGKGVPTNPTDTFQKMATNIGAIETDKTGDATALAGDIVKGKTAYSKGNKLTGTLELTGNAFVNRVLEGNTFYNNDLKRKLVGTMPNLGVLSETLTSQGGQLNFSGGYYEKGSVKAQFPNLISTNVKKGVNIGGVLGSYDGDPDLIRYEYIYKDSINDNIKLTDSVYGEILYVIVNNTINVGSSGDFSGERNNVLATGINKTSATANAYYYLGDNRYESTAKITKISSSKFEYEFSGRLSHISFIVVYKRP